MSDPFPHVVNLLAAVKAALETVKKIGGSRVDLVVREPSFSPSPQQADVEAELAFERWDLADDSPHEFSDIDVFFTVRVIVRRQPDAEITMQQFALLAASDVVKAVQRDRTQNSTARNTESMSADAFDETADGTYWIGVLFKSRVRYELDNP